MYVCPITRAQTYFELQYFTKLALASVYSLPETVMQPFSPPVMPSSLLCIIKTGFV